MDPEANRLLASVVAAGTRSQLEPHVRTIELAHGEVLAEPLAPMRRVYFPYSGIISFLVPLTDGYLVQTSLVGDDGAVGALQALDGRVSPNKIVVQVPSRAAVIDADHFGRIAQAAPGVRALLLSHEQFFVAEVQQSAACNAVHTVRQRMCRWLLRMNDLAGTTIAVTQEMFSDMLGVQRTSVTLAAASLQKAGVIRYRRGHVQILDVHLLERSSCECYGALKRSYNRLVRHSDADAAVYSVRPRP
jgi:CRP-like cAMP-binding protein